MRCSTAERACIKMTESRNRLRTAVEQLKQDLEQDIEQSGLYFRKYKAEVRQACQATVAQKPFASLAVAFAAGLVLGKWLKYRRRQQEPCCL